MLHKYVALNATQLLKDGYTLEALALYVTHGTPAMTQNFNIYTRIALDLFEMPGIADNYNIWAQLRKILFELVRLLTFAYPTWAKFAILNCLFCVLIFIINIYTYKGINIKTI